MPEGRARIDTPGIYADLQHRLLTGAFVPQVKLMPTVLNGEYGVSANTVRDVLLRLSQIGLVEFEIQRGFRTPGVSLERRAQLASFRILLEQEGAVLSMRNGGLAWETRLTAAHHALLHIERQLARRPEDTIPFVGIWSDGELAFHRTLISECALPPLIDTFERTYMQFRQQMVGLEANCVPSYFARIVAEHQLIVDAATGGDEAGLRAAVRAHQGRHLDR
ncbi:GntR family transcriptional regulator [Jannaschia sp.]|nr:GntR family transcriptional regulator [Jannaschia sp.]